MSEMSLNERCAIADGSCAHLWDTGEHYTLTSGIRIWTCLKCGCQRYTDYKCPYAPMPTDIDYDSDIDRAFAFVRRMGVRLDCDEFHGTFKQIASAMCEIVLKRMPTGAPRSYKIDFEARDRALESMRKPNGNPTP